MNLCMLQWIGLFILIVPKNIGNHAVCNFKNLLKNAKIGGIFLQEWIFLEYFSRNPYIFCRVEKYRRIFSLEEFF